MLYIFSCQFTFSSTFSTALSAEGETLPRPCNTLSTVPAETPAISAMSLIRILCGFLVIVCVFCTKIIFIFRNTKLVNLCKFHRADHLGVLSVCVAVCVGRM